MFRFPACGKEDALDGIWTSVNRNGKFFGWMEKRGDYCGQLTISLLS
jgi:hypothetical protein